MKLTARTQAVFVTASALVLLGLVVFLGYASRSPRIESLVVCVDAPQMLTGPGSVVILDSSQQPGLNPRLHQLAHGVLSHKVGWIETNALVGVPFLYVRATWSTGEKTVLSSSFVMDENKKDSADPVDVVIRQTLQTLGVTQAEVNDALSRAEKSEIIDEPIKKIDAGTMKLDPK